MKLQLVTIFLVTIVLSCNRNKNKTDAAGTFEADEVVVSAAASGKILSLNIDEGSVIAKDSVVGLVDPTDLSLQKQQVQASIHVQRTNVETQNRSILSEGKPLGKKAEELQNQLNKTNIKNPVDGTVITKYAEAGEITSNGKALYKIADLSTMTLRAYVTGEQLPQIKLGQPVQVLIDSGANKYRTYRGTITWISDKAEFTPKNIQTKDERANLVYAAKIKVKNDGYLKIGMYGEVKFKSQNP